MLTERTAAELAHLLASREVSATEVATAFLDRAEAEDSRYGSFLSIDREGALAQAKAAQDRLDRGEGAPLTGVPIALKDNLSTRDLETTCASKILKGYVPPYDATVVRRLRDQGLPILGKTNLDEFAMGTSTENSAFQLTRNPWDVSRSPGGSSGGSAAAVSAGLSPLSLGSDTGGSIRQPASLCGLVGFKPTYGRCSRYGLVAFASSLDQIGPFARTVEDVALISEAITGYDPSDSTSRNALPIRAASLKEGSLKGLRIALPEELFGEAIRPEVRARVEEAMRAFEREGATLSTVSCPQIRYGVTTYYLIAPAEASSNLARFDGVRFGPRASGGGHIGLMEKTRGQLFGHEVKARIMIGTYALSAGYYDAYYQRACEVRDRMKQDFDGLYRDFDLVLSPTSPCTAFKLGELKDDPLALKMLDYCTIPANLIGAPAISIPCGEAEGLPVGLQLMAAPMEDERLLQAAYAAERLLGVAPRPAGL